MVGAEASIPSRVCKLIHISISPLENLQLPPTLNAGIFLDAARR